MTIFNDLKKAVKQIGNLDRDIKRVFKDLERLPGRVKKDIERDLIQPLRSEVDGGFKSVRGEIDSGFKSVRGEIEGVAKGALDELENAAEKVLAELVAAGISEAGEQVARFLRIVEPHADILDSFSVNISIFGFTWDDFDTKIGVVASLLEGGVKSDKASILSYIEALAPSSVQISLDAAFALVASSSAVSVGGSVTLSVDAALDLIDDLLD